MEAPLDLGGMVQSSPLPSVRSLPRNPPPYSQQQQQSEADFHSYGNICQQQQQQQQSHSADDPNSSIIEHHLIAQYAQELHQGGGGSSTGGGDGGSYINTAPDPGGHMLQQSRELVKTCFDHRLAFLVCLQESPTQSWQRLEFCPKFLKFI